MRNLKKILQNITQTIRRHRTFFLSGHQNPDGDTVASELALSSLLRRLGKRPEIYNVGAVPQSLMFLPGVKRIKSAQRVAKVFDVAIIFECFDSHRMGDIIDLDRQAKVVVNIDHHLMHSNYGDINLINPKASSNSEQLYYLFEKLKMPITKDEATCLYAGIMADTGRFMHSNTNAETLRIASKLVERGVDVSFLTEKMFGTRTFSALKLLGFCLTGLNLVESGRIAYAKITRDDLKRLGSGDDETEAIVNYGLEVPSVLVSFLLRETGRDGLVKVSLRSRRNVNVCELAQQFGGGGHKYASGCKISGGIDTVADKLIKAAQKIV